MATTTNPDALAPYRVAGVPLIPLGRWDRVLSDGTPAGKMPTSAGWQRREFDPGEMVDHMRAGANVGARLGGGWLVIDYDPRNDSSGDALDRFLLHYQLDRERFAEVRTGSGGAHLYMRAPADFHGRNALPDQFGKGVEFKGRGRQVVAAGSIHPNGQRYEFVPGRPSLAETGEAPAALLADLAPKAPPPFARGKGAEGFGNFAPDQVADALAKLDAPRFGKAGDLEWFTLMCACHWASGGAAREEFVEWSISDAAYAGDAELIRTRWDSLSEAGSGHTAKAGYLFKCLDAHDVPKTDQPRERAAVIFGDELDTADLRTPVIHELGAAILDERNMVDAARLFIATRYPNGTLILWRDDFYRFGSEGWATLSASNLKGEVLLWLAEQRKAIPKSTDGATEPFRPTSWHVTELLNAVRALTVQTFESAPAWLGPGDAPGPARELIALQNGILNMRTRTLTPLDARFFTVGRLDFAYDPNADCPRWQAFLESVWPKAGGDADHVDALQELFGYLVSGSNALQKIAMLVGPSRSGKGTIADRLCELIGKRSAVKLETAALANDFSLQMLAGHSLAILSDSRAEGVKHYGPAVTERLLTISGGAGEMLVNKKHTDAEPQRVDCRFVVLANPPVTPFMDRADALSKRLTFYTMTESFYGREDVDLGDKLHAELPGILNWALDGLDRVRRNRRLAEPASSKRERESYRRAQDSVTAFLEDECELGGELRVSKQALFGRYRSYCKQRNIIATPTEELFSGAINAATARQLKTTRPRSDNPERLRMFEGIGLKPVYEDIDDLI